MGGGDPAPQDRHPSPASATGTKGWAEGQDRGRADGPRAPPGDPELWAAQCMGELVRGQGSVTPGHCLSLSPFCRCPCPPAVSVSIPLGPAATSSPPQPGGSSLQHPWGTVCPTGSPGHLSHWYPSPGDQLQWWQLPGTHCLHDIQVPPCLPPQNGSLLPRAVVCQVGDSRDPAEQRCRGTLHCHLTPAPAAGPGGQSQYPRAGRGMQGQWDPLAGCWHRHPPRVRWRGGSRRPALSAVLRHSLINSD